MMDEAHKKAEATRKANAAAKKQRQAEHQAQEKADRELILGALRAVLADPAATPSERLYAVTVLDNMQHYHIKPYGIDHPARDTHSEADLSRLREAFKKELEAIQSADT